MLNLLQEYGRLNDEQKDAVRHDDNTVVLAGPGSGKTATLVIKVAHLLSGVLEPPSGLACITYNNDAVKEFSRRLADFGIYAGRRLFLGTVHSFCLNCVLRPYAGLVHARFRDGVSVAGPRRAEALLEKALAKHLPDTNPAYYSATLTKLRRRKACGEDISGFDDRDPLVLKEYEGLLADEELVDFEWMVTLALELIRENEWIRDLLSARFPWLIVDEYQDLGGPLHRIVTTLVDDAGIKVFAVGDPDQTIYDFTGADPRYLVELSKHRDFKPIRLRFNYRSGQRLIDASQAALSPDEPRAYQSDPEKADRGEVFFVKADDDLADHAVKAVTAIQQALKQKTPHEEIAVFYQRRTVLLDDLKAELAEKNVPFIAERDSKYPSSPIVRWLQDAASWSISAPIAREQLFEDLARHYAGLLVSAGRSESYVMPLEARMKLCAALTDEVDASVSLRDWLLKIDAQLGIHDAVVDAEDRSDDQESLEELLQLTETGDALADTKLLEFACDGRVRGKVVLTTFHSSKGRQFDVVVIPGCVEGVLPAWTWNRQRFRYDQPSERVLRETRRLFYVGFTRARKAVYLVYSKGYVHKGHPVELGVSRFAIEISNRLRAK